MKNKFNSRNVLFYTFSNTKQFINHWNSLAKTVISKLFIYSHGNAGYLDFGDKDIFYFSTVAQLLKKLNVCGMVYLLSCYGGSGSRHGSVASEVSKLTGAKVRAAVKSRVMLLYGINPFLHSADKLYGGYWADFKSYKTGKRWSTKITNKTKSWSL